VLQIPADISDPAVMRDPPVIDSEGKHLDNISPYRVISLARALELCRRGIARESGTTVQRAIDASGRKSKPVFRCFELRSDSSEPRTLTADSGNMRPANPTRGPVSGCRYSRSLDAFASKCPAARRIFRAWEGATVIGGRDKDDHPIWKRYVLARRVSNKLIEDVPQERSVLYMPSAGLITSKGRDISPQDASNEPKDAENAQI
jgi:hypothetical protein